MSNLPKRKKKKDKRSIFYVTVTGHLCTATVTTVQKGLGRIVCLENNTVGPHGESI
jgi:hypothetical protein